MYSFLIVRYNVIVEKLVQHILDGTKNIEFNNWIDLNYYSSFISRNPDLLLVNQVKDVPRKGNLVVHNPLRLPKQHNSIINFELLMDLHHGTYTNHCYHFPSLVS